MLFMQKEVKMLKNKFFIAFIGISLAVAIIYNISFFANRRNSRSSNQNSHSVEAALSSLPTDANSIYKPSKIVDNLRRITLENKPWGRNPFLTPEEELSLQMNHHRGEKGEERKVTAINGILIGQNQRVAIIDHTIVTEGDWIGSEQVVKIDKNKAILAIGKNRRSIVMDAPSIAISVEESIDKEGKDEM